MSAPQTARSRNTFARALLRHGRAAFTLVELLVVIAIIAILAGMILPTLARGKDKGKTAACANNVRQLYLATLMYEEDYKVFPIGWYPSLVGPRNWEYQLQPYVGKKTTTWAGGVYNCPSGKGFWGDLTYSMNYEINLNRADICMRNIKDAVNTILFADTDGWDSCLYPDTNATGNVLYRHSGGGEFSAKTLRVAGALRTKMGRANSVFMDGHIRLLKQAETNLFTLARD